MKSNHLSVALAALLATAVAAPAWAQSGSRSDDNRNRSDQRERSRSPQDQRREQDQRRDRQDQRRWEDSRQGQQGRQGQRRDDGQQSNRYRLQPQGWVAVAYDYDQDGRYDATEYLYYYDVQQARKSSEQRRQGQRGERRGSDNQMARSGQQGDRQRVRFHGEITKLGDKKLMDGDSERADREYRCARVEKESGKSCRVVLGPMDKVEQLDLQEGDQVTVEGVRVKIDGKEVLFAKRVSTDNDSLTNQLPKPFKMRRLDGEVARVRRTDEGRGDRHLVVKLRNSDKSIDLGPTSELQDIDLQQGDRVSVLARQGKIAGESVMIAQKVRANGQTIDVREATNRSLYGGNQSR